MEERDCQLMSTREGVNKSGIKRERERLRDSLGEPNK